MEVKNVYLLKYGAALGLTMKIQKQILEMQGLSSKFDGSSETMLK